MVAPGVSRGAALSGGSRTLPGFLFAPRPWRTLGAAAGQDPTRR